MRLNPIKESFFIRLYRQSYSQCLWLFVITHLPTHLFATYLLFPCCSKMMFLVEVCREDAARAGQQNPLPALK